MAGGPVSAHVASAPRTWQKPPVARRATAEVRQVRHRQRDREILSLAWPAVLGASIDPLLSLLDTYWVSRCLGMVSLAALGPALNVEDWMFDILKTVQVPVRTLTSEAVAAKKPVEVSKVLAQALCFCWRIGLAVALLGSVLAPLLLRLSSVEATSPLLGPAKAYLVPRLWGSPGLLTLIVLQATLSSAFRDTGAVLRLVLLGAGINAVLTPLAVVLLKGGTAGAAWATTFACYCSAAAAWFTVARRPGGPWLPPLRQLAARALLLRKAEESKGWMKLLAANAAMTARSFSSLTTWLVACGIITKIGVAPLAAHTCMTKTFLSFLYLLYGFQLSSQVLVSADLAQQKPKRARWTALRATRMGMVVAVATAFALWVGRDSIANTLVRDPSVTAAFETLVPPAMVMLLIYGAMWVADGVLYGFGEYVWVAKCTTCAAASAGIFMLLFSTLMQPTASHIWWSLNVMMAIRAIFGIHRVFFSKKSPLSKASLAKSSVVQSEKT